MIRQSIADRTGYSFEGGGPDGNLFTFAELTVAMVRENSADPQTVMQALADTLIAAHKINPGMLCVGVDLDSRCAKMTALNFLFRGIKGDVYCGNTPTNEMQTVWKVLGTLVTEHDVPPTPIEPEPPTQLTLI